MIGRVVALVALGLVLAACGGGEDASRFDAEVQRIRQAVEAGDREAAMSSFAAIELLGLDARATGELDDAEVEELARLVEQGRALLDQELPAPTTTTTTTAPPFVAESDEGWDDDRGDERDEHDEHDEDDDRGRGKQDDKGGKGDRDD